MSLWEKWEKEKLEKMGVKVERRSDVIIHDTRQKTDLHKQALIVLGALAACFLMVYLAITFDALSTGRRWSETYIVRFFVERNAQRIAKAENE